MPPKADRLILVGLDGLNAEMVERFASQGKLPHMAGLMAGGPTSGRISISQQLWFVRRSAFHSVGTSSQLRCCRVPRRRSKRSTSDL